MSPRKPKVDHDTKLMCLNLVCRVELFEAGDHRDVECPACGDEGEIDE